MKDSIELVYTNGYKRYYYSIFVGFMIDYKE